MVVNNFPPCVTVSIELPRYCGIVMATSVCCLRPKSASSSSNVGGNNQPPRVEGCDTDVEGGSTRQRMV